MSEPTPETASEAMTERPTESTTPALIIPLPTRLRLRELYKLPRYQKEVIDLGAFTVTVQLWHRDQFGQDQWWACLNGDAGIWTVGQSLDFVVGSIALTWTDEHHYLSAEQKHLADGVRRAVQKPEPVPTT